MLELNTIPIVGTYTAYEGDGYVYELRGSLASLKGNLTLLQQMNWVDLQTRAVIIEFFAYNPNVNMLIASSILVEFLPTGHVLTSAHFDPITLFETNTNLSILKVACELVYMLFIVFFMYKEVRLLLKTGIWVYVQFWTLIEWSIILLSWASFAIYIYKRNEAARVLSFFSSTAGYAYINLQQLNQLSQTLVTCLATCSLLSTLKLMKLLRFNGRIYLMALTLNKCLRELVNFSIIFSIYWLSFVQLLYLVFNGNVAGFSTILSSMQTSFLMLLQSPVIEQMPAANAFVYGFNLSAIVYTAYSVLITLVMVNMLVSIINSSFNEQFCEVVTNGDHVNVSDIVAYIAQRIKLGNARKLDTKSSSELAETLISKFDRILAALTKVIFIKD